MDSQITEKLFALAAPAVKGEGCELFDLEFKPGKGSALLRIYIDKEGGVGVEDCARVSKQLDLVLEAEELIPGAYTLEVSSPGLTRPLKKPTDFIRSVGKLAAVSARRTLPSGKGGKFIGVIEKADTSTMDLRLKSGDLVSISLTDVTRANLEIEF